MSIIDTIQRSLDQSAVSKISQRLGIDPSVAQRCVQAAVPLLVAGMARHATDPQAAVTIQQSAEQHRNLLDNVAGILHAGPPADSSALLTRILGPHRDTVREGVQQASGLEPEQSHQLLQMLAPIALGALARAHLSGHRTTTPEQMSGALQDEARSARSQLQRTALPPPLRGVLGELLGNL